MSKITREFVENSDGVHLMSDAEYTLCSDAYEGDPPNGIEPCHETRKRIVTCERCANIIRMCRGVRIATADPTP